MPQDARSRSRRRAPARRRRGPRVLLIAAALAVCALGGGWWLWAGPGPATKELSVAVPEGATLSRAAGQLEKAGAIHSRPLFLAFAKLLGEDGTIRAGEYRIAPGTSARQILEMLQQGKTRQRLVTVPEGMPSVLVAEALLKAPGLTGEVETPVEGSVLPDSYAYVRDEPRAAVLARMQKAMTAYLAKAWAERDKGLAMTTPREAIILASIVEKETGKPAERTTVAAVYANRLKAGMPLQADPTIIYPITKGKPLGRRILQSELRARNGYNTYTMRGLPEGPIANPGRASIDAVLHPADSKALYFVADGTGGHVFAETYQQHQANVAKWYALRRARGEM
ncbi:endolytic transglycosylase MltG [Sphingomonas elodea]|uniref:endolytic transglycosylase MltG n=1 Tax=Sphingomonas elodea TaxID=179878 RepID=UPI0002631DB3|nr:endolytic transglycosylase MltG [Sphingomonas elodea]